MEIKNSHISNSDTRTPIPTVISTLEDIKTIIAHVVGINTLFDVHSHIGNYEVIVHSATDNQIQTLNDHESKMMFVHFRNN